MAHPGRCDRPSWIGFGGKSKRRNFLAMDGPDLREQIVVGEWPLGAADPGVDPCRNAQAEIGAALPIDACGSIPAAGPLRYLKAPIIPVFAKHTRRKPGLSRRVDLVSLVLSASVLPDSRR